MYCKNESDETLVMLTLAGEQSAYEVLVTRYQKLVIDLHCTQYIQEKENSVASLLAGLLFCFSVMHVVHLQIKRK